MAEQPEPALEMARRMARGGLDGTLELIYDEVTPDLVRAHLRVGERHLQLMGVTHGGVYAAVAESLASVGALVNARARHGGADAMGVENHTSFLRPSRAGAELHAEAVPRQAGRRAQTWTVSIRDAADGREVAISVVRLVVLAEPGTPPPPA